MLIGTTLEQKFRVEQEAQKKSSADLVKVFIDNIILAIKINTSIQEISSHLANM